MIASGTVREMAVIDADAAGECARAFGKTGISSCCIRWITNSSSSISVLSVVNISGNEETIVPTRCECPHARQIAPRFITFDSLVRLTVQLDGLGVEFHLLMNCS